MLPASHDVLVNGCIPSIPGVISVLAIIRELLTKICPVLTLVIMITESETKE